MKNYIFIIFFGITCLSCSKNDNTTNLLVGTWNWVESSGGIDGRTETPISTGNSIKLEISKNSVKKYLNGNLVSELSYSIQFEKYNGVQQEIIVYENQPDQIISLNGNYLTLFDKCPDCFQYEYIKDYKEY